MSAWNNRDFRNFLKENQNLTAVVASNYAARCSRIERVLGVDLVEATRTASNYSDLTMKVHKYFMSITKDKRKLYSLNGNHMNAIRKLGLFLWGRTVMETYEKNVYRKY